MKTKEAAREKAIAEYVYNNTPDNYIAPPQLSDLGRLYDAGYTAALAQVKELRAALGGIVELVETQRRSYPNFKGLWGPVSGEQLAKAKAALAKTEATDG